MQEMATIAGVWSRFFSPGVERTGQAAERRNSSARVRAFANDDILFYVKRIDNSRVVREADPAARGRCWKLIGSAVGAVVLLVGVLLPSAYGLMAGYQIQSLRQEGQRLDADQASLELREAQLLSPARMEQLAREQQFVDPAPQKVMYLDGPQGSLALNNAVNEK
jgi:hypothetical protein